METPMKLTLIGLGKMGQVVETAARRQAMEVVDRFTSDRPLSCDDATRRKLTDVAAAVDFSIPEAVLPTVRAAADLSLNLVIGTTGWNDQLDEVRQTAQSSGLGIVWASNFSIGVNIFYRVVDRAAKIFSGLEGYDPFIQDWHHKFKKDSPSGTALELRRRMARHYGDRELPITSLRAGYVPSVHAVGFDSAGDTVHLEHRARSRQGFADGALLAAKWIAGRQGFFEFREVLDDLYPGG